MVIVMALGGSTNAVLHLIAMARSVDVPLTLDDFQAVSDRVPLIADLKPSGKYVQEDLHREGGTPAVMKHLLAAGLMSGDCPTVTGKTVAENLAELPGLNDGQEIIRPLDHPIKPTGHIQILYGNLAYRGCSSQNHRKRRRVFRRNCQGVRFGGGNGVGHWSSIRLAKVMSSSFDLKGPKVDQACLKC